MVGATSDLSKGAKNDQGKLRMSLMDSGLPREVARVLTHGAIKYAPNNWRKFDSVNNEEERERLANAQMRHYYAWQDGEIYDPDSFEDRLRAQYDGEKLELLLKCGPLMHQAQVAFYSMIFIRNNLDNLPTNARMA